MESFKRWLDEQGKSKQTIEVYARSVQQMKKWWEQRKGVPFDPLITNQQDLEQWLHYMRSEAKYFPAKNQEPRFYSLSTIKSLLAGVRSYFHFISEKRETNPAISLHLNMNDYAKAAGGWLTLELKGQLLQWIDQEISQSKKERRNQLVRNKAIIYMALFAGLTAGEIVKGTIKDISFEDSLIRVRNRVVPLDENLLVALKDWLKITSKQPHERLFSSQKGNLTADGITNFLILYAQKIGLNGLSLQTLRHTYARSLAEEGTSTIEIARLLGVHPENARRYRAGLRR